MRQGSFQMTGLQRFALAGYGVVMRTLQILLPYKLRRRARQEPEYGLNVAQRLGQYDGNFPDGGFVWLHAVSLGETRAAALLLPALREAFPGMRLLLTHGTATGRVQGKALLQPGDVQVWLPWDTARASRQFLMHFKPRLGLLVDTEVWPQLVQACRRAGVPLCLVNARMSEKSWRSAMRLAPLSRPAFAGLSLVLAQSSGDAERLKILGCPHVQVAGNLKFDVQVNALSRELASRWQGAFAGRTVVMLASMREGEESLWLQALQSNPSRMEKLKARGVLWLMVPRHPQRFDAVHDLLVKAGWRCERRSSWADHEPDAIRIAATDVVLGDSLGEMQAYYLASRMALLGGSFAPFGGQNLIEAAACACPVVMGPNTFNFSDAAALAVQQGAAVQVRDMQAALEHVVLALDNPQWLDQAQAATLGVMAQGQGAVAQHVRALLAMVNAINQEVA